MGTTDICVKGELHKNLFELKKTLDFKSFSELLQFLMENYLDAPKGVPVKVFDELRGKYIATYPDEFRDATRMAIGISDPDEFRAVIEETMIDLIKENEMAPEQILIFQCSKCQHVWDYRGKMKKVSGVHCSMCGSSASSKWLRDLVPKKLPENFA